MTMKGESGESLVIRRFIPVARARVYAAWLDPASLAQWMRPTGMTDATVDVDARVGGRFRIVMVRGAQKFEHSGEYLIIEPPERLSFSWISQATDLRSTVVTIHFLERDAGTDLILTHRLLPASQIESHRSGWTDVVLKLSELLRR